jgi:hypothetical protein
MKSRSTVMTLIIATVLGACGTSPNEKPDAGGVDAGPEADAGSDAGSTDGGTVQPTLSDIQAKIFTPNCSTGACHNAMFSGLSGQLDLSSASASYSSLVNVPVVYSGAPAGELRVDPGNPGSSFIVIKLVNMWQAGYPQYGNPMPYTGTQLPENQIQAIEQWITNGAAND